LTPGAYNAINICLRLKPEERITLIADEENLEIAYSLIYEIEKVGSQYKLFVLEDIAQRPLKTMPQVILDDLAKSQVSNFLLQFSNWRTWITCSNGFGCDKP